MTCTFTPLLTLVDCAGDPTFSELLCRVAEYDALAREHAQLPYDELVELLALEGTRRGEPIRTGSELNFLSHSAHSSRARRTTFAWNPEPSGWAAYGSDTYLRIYELRDAVVIALNAASAVMDAAAVERFLRAYETVLLAHADPGTDLRLSEIATLADFRAPAGSLPAAETPVGSPEAVEALVAGVRQANGLEDVDPAAGYVLGGGRVLRIPRVLQLLEERGYKGLTVYQLASPLPLQTLAGQLTVC
jgi:hypothetical protein